MFLHNLVKCALLDLEQGTQTPHRPAGGIGNLLEMLKLADAFLPLVNKSFYALA